MKTYAQVNLLTNKVINIFPFENIESFPPPEGSLFVDITDLSIGIGWDYIDGEFIEPAPPYVDPRPAIIGELADIDRASARPLRVLIITDPNVGLGTPERAELEALELRAEELRQILDNLPPPPVEV